MLPKNACYHLETECRKPKLSGYKIDGVNTKNMIRAWVYGLTVSTAVAK